MRRQLSFALLLLITSSVHASLVFDFSFDNSANGGGTVNGVIRGLSNGDSAATSVYVTSYTGPLAAGVGEYAWTAPAAYNRWTVANGAIADVVFDGYLYPNTVSDPLVAALSFGTPPPSRTQIKAALFTSYDTAAWNPVSPTYTLRNGNAPAPATIALFSLGLLGANWVRWQRAAIKNASRS